MKLISCYIAGFGKFVDESFDLSAPLTVLKQDNGWGKTTLADFLRCMLYGLDGGRVRAIESNDRARYEPWQGGTFGGSLTFSYGGKRYRIERVFGKTPAYDVARLYDENNMQCFRFGERVDKLGELLFGVNAESYKKSVYIPQGEIASDGLPDDIKTRLLSLLSTGGTGENGADRALEKLEAADRALRAKRRPAQGKLDSIDERLAYIAREIAVCKQAEATAAGLSDGLKNAEAELENHNRRLIELNAAIEKASRQSELAVKKQAYNEAQTRLSSAKAELAKLGEFFDSIDPATVNTEGLRAAVTEFYDLKGEYANAEAHFCALDEEFKEKSAVKTELETAEKVLSSYASALGYEEREGAGTPRKEKGRLIVPQKRRSTKWIVALSLALAVTGALLIETLLVVALCLLGLGGVGLLAMFLRVLPRREKTHSSSAPVPAPDNGLSRKYAEGSEEKARIEERLKAFPLDLDEAWERAGKEKEGILARMNALERAICNFLQNFRFGEVYDYRAALSALQEKIFAHARVLEAVKTEEARVQEHAEGATVYEKNPVFDLSALKEEKAEIERRKDELTRANAKTLADIETLESRADTAALQAEEGYLSEEKNRLEKRHRAILAAKRYLLQAKENMASRYLDPVSRGCRYYLDLLGGEKDKLRFNADGAPLCEEGGRLREIGFYSAGMKELVGFCLRVALVDAVFTKEAPVLVLDDPFVNLDDEKTERAKRLVKELSRRYQIIYMTCKKERTLSLFP